MNKRVFSIIVLKIRNFFLGILEFSFFFSSYLKKKLISSINLFEANKNSFVKLFMIKRGRYSRLFLHFATIGVLGLGILIAPFLASTYPVFSKGGTENTIIASSNTKQSITVGTDVFQTEISQKPRDKVIDYTVQKGDTISTIAKKFGISDETINWANNLTSDNITVGDTLKILPVTGVSYKVQKGDTVYAIADKFSTNAQKIVDFPFNEFANPETFSLVEGQMLVVPDGVKGAEKAPSTPRYVPNYAPVRGAGNVAQAPLNYGGFAWPLRGGLSQYASWYHMAIDITNSVGTPIVSAQDGRVVSASVGTWDGGYGTSVTVKGDNGISTHYAHMSAVNVSAGQTVAAGKSVLGWVGMTGRTTGPHLHFEVRQNGGLINPLSILQ